MAEAGTPSRPPPRAVRLISTMERREFLALMSTAAAGALSPAPVSAAGASSSAPTVQAVLDLLIAASARAPFPGTVDTVKTGDPTRPVTGIVTTFMANVEVIERAIASGANLIVTHEPTFYNHLDDTTWLAADAVYQAKRKLIDDHGIVVFRYHDLIHTIEPDPIEQATIDQLGWTRAAVAGEPRVFALEPRPFATLVTEVKHRLGASLMRVMGDPALPCRRVGLLVGAPGGRAHLSFLARHPVDALVVGEIAEWETSEYVRDANRLGRPLGLIVTGHSVSEALGMKWLAGWLRECVAGVPVEYVPAPAPFAGA
jgi:putative NIF3 family GTP cyclohydrolase 1 type 2